MSVMIIESPATERDLLSAYGVARSTIQDQPLSDEGLRKIHAYWRACNYLSLGMIYLQDNPLLRAPLKREHIKNRLLGHWGASPGLAFTYVHLNRLIQKYDLNMIFLAGPGHGAPGVLGPVYLEGTYSAIYTDKGEDERGLKEFFKQFSFPGVSAATARRKHRARSMKAASLGMCSRTPVAPPSTIPIWS